MFEKEMIYRVLTPLVVVEKGAEKHCFYTNAEFEKWMHGRTDLAKWDIAYKKGLAALQDAEYQDIIQHPKMFALTPGHNLREVLDCWFAGDAKPRKDKILNEVDDG